ncbi:sensor histidine kinase [Streptomyces bambusae]|uniref:histidine kinase n=1 Tax=Streptomyces bambusae TaxID=1550616 RepID=A0ABS6Z4W6_9ACTN|nr:histidine kinase [Streptomyces bambusae]MBW5482816.1 sensor histidine kinase [Streptomyces bambusae]
MADPVLALLVQVATTIPFVVPRGPQEPPATLAAYLLTSLGNLPLVWRRRAPVLVAFGVMAAGGVYRLSLDGPGQPLPYAGLIVLYTIALLCPPRVRTAMAAITVVVVFVSVALNTRTPRELLFSLFVFAAAYALGRLQATRQAYTAAVEDRAAQLERANRIEAEQAAARERARIAREMHDILSHAVSIMVVQAEAGPLAVRRDPERAEAAFDAIAETGRDAMAQLRRMLGVLRDEGDGHGGAPRAPQPGVAGLPALLERVRLGGPEVAYERTGRVRALPGAVDTAVHRVVQEALTNVVKHARATSVAVRIDYGEEDVTVTVTDDGRGAGVQLSGGRVSGRQASGMQGAGEQASGMQGAGEQASGMQGAGEQAFGGRWPGGHGLIGIRERAAAHGGTASAGPGPDGTGFELRVRLVTSAPEVGN